MSTTVTTDDETANREIDLINCECGASLPPAVLARNNMQCPECRAWWQPCPACYHWHRQLKGIGHWRCPNCRLDGQVRTDLRVGNRPLKEVRKDSRVPQFEPLDGDDGMAVNYPERGQPEVAD